MFPFLIGRIRTTTNADLIGGDVDEFPFLIGRIRTLIGGDVDDDTISLFPFLIGRIRTQSLLIHKGCV